jgi:hypothetical protein
MINAGLLQHHCISVDIFLASSSVLVLAIMALGSVCPYWQGGWMPEVPAKTNTVRKYRLTMKLIGLPLILYINDQNNAQL